MQRIDFNTGRNYTAEGQQITAEVIAQKHCEIMEETWFLVLMTDHSRGLDYLYEMPQLTRRNVMNRYDGVDGQCLRLQSEDGYNVLRDFWKVDYRGNPINADFDDWHKKPVFINEAATLYL